MALISIDKITQLQPAATCREAAKGALDNIQLSAVAYSINSASNSGELSVIYQDTLSEATENALTSQGYKLEVIGETNKSTKISWSED